MTTPDAAPEAGESRWQISTEALRAYTMVFALIVLWIYFQVRTRSELYPYGLFLHPVNFANLLKQMAVTGVLAVGMLFVIIARQIDLSVGSIVGLAGGIAAMSQGWGLGPSLLSALVIGMVIGALQGTLTAYLNIPSFIVTLGGLLTWRGVILYLSKGETIPVRLGVFRMLGVALITPASGLVLAAVAIVAVFWLTIRRNRARARHGLAVPGTAATAARSSTRPRTSSSPASARWACATTTCTWAIRSTPCGSSCARERSSARSSSARRPNRPSAGT